MNIKGLDYFKHIMQVGGERSVLLKKNIVISFLNKAVAVVVSFILVSVTINYVNTEQYGIWLTLSSLIYWISLFDFGMTHGFRNRFAEAISNNDRLLCKKYVSTSYVLLSIIFLSLLLILAIVNVFINWSSFLNLDQGLNETLRMMFYIIIICFCLKNILRVVTTMFTADQRPAIAAIITTMESVLVLSIIWVLTRVKTGSLIDLALVSSGVPLILIIAVSFYTFYIWKRYSDLRPTRATVDFTLSRKILGLGGKFFIIQLCMLVVFQSINIIISRYLGPEQVTLYNVAHKYYSVFYAAFIIIVTPYWSATTNAYVTGDLEWIRRNIKRLKSLLIICGAGQVILILVSPWLIKLWLGDAVEVPLEVSLTMALNIWLMSYSAMYMYMINGIGKVKLQMIIYLIFACLSIPLMILGCKYFGLISIISVTSVVYAVLGIVGKLQMNKLLNQTANGIWNK